MIKCTENHLKKLSDSDEVNIMMEIVKNHRDEMNIKIKEYGKQTNYLLALLSIIPGVVGLYLQSNYTLGKFLIMIKENWVITFTIIFSLHLIALFLAGKVASELHFILINGHVVKKYESLISSYLPKEAEIRWERYWSPEFGFSPFPYKNSIVLNPNYFAAIALSIFVILLNIGSIIIAYQANNKWYFVTFIIPLLWIYMAIIHIYVSLGWFNWEKKPANIDFKIFLLLLFLFLYISIFFTSGYEDVLLKPGLEHSLLKVYSVFPGDLFLLLSSFFFLQLIKSDCFRKLSKIKMSLILVFSLILSGIQHFVFWTKDNLAGFMDPNVTHLGITGWIHFLMESVGLFLWGLIVFQLKVKSPLKERKYISLGFLFLFFYIICLYIDSMKSGGNLWFPSITLLSIIFWILFIFKSKELKK